MKKIALISILIASFVTKSFAYCPIPQWCPNAPLYQTLCHGEQIEDIEFPSVIAKVLIVTWWTDGTRIHSFATPPPGITVSGAASTPLGDREYAWPVSIKGAPTDPGTHHYTVSNTCGVELLHGSITLAPPPIIGMVTPTIDQATPQNIAFPSTLTLTADPTGMQPITIQWYSSTTPSSAAGTGGTAVSGAIGNTFTPPATTINTTGVYYYAVATDRCNNTATTNNTSGKHTVTIPIPIPTCTPAGEINCNMTQIPTFAGGSLGTPYFRTSQIWSIFGNGISQEWSDVVLAPGCNHVTYSVTGNATTPYTSACKWSLNNSGVPAGSNGTRPTTTQAPGTSTYYGDFFSWCMLHRYVEDLCPDTWRVPTCQDFVNLDVALGGTGINRSGAGDVRDKLTNISGTAGQFWGGTYGGFCNGAGVLYYQGAYADYWSSTQLSGTNARYLYINTNGTVNPQDSYYGKVQGMVLRCVR